MCFHHNVSELIYFLQFSLIFHCLKAGFVPSPGDKLMVPEICPPELVSIVDGSCWMPSHIARFMGSVWGPPGADRTQVGPMLVPWTLLSRLSPIPLSHNATKLGPCSNLWWPHSLFVNVLRCFVNSSSTKQHQSLFAGKWFHLLCNYTLEEKLRRNVTPN